MWRPVLALGLTAGFSIPLEPLQLTAVGCVFFPLSSLVPPETTNLGALYAVFFVVCAVCGVALRSAYELCGSEDKDARVALFLVAVMPFHIIEFVFVCIYQRRHLTASAFLLRPVPMHGYCVAMMAAIVEYTIIPIPFFPTISWIGYFLAFTGWAIRSSALFTAQANFTHCMRDTKDPRHELVTHGIYSVVRHPGYAGWFLWAVSTQIILHNVLCMVAYAAVSFAFFVDRIREEEQRLVRFFGKEYFNYADRVPCGIPFITNL